MNPAAREVVAVADAEMRSPKPVQRSSSISSREGARRSAKSRVVGDPLPISTAAVARERGIDDDLAQIWRLEEGLYWRG
jgi:hypothetical protein